MPQNAKYLLAIGFGYFIMPKLVLEFWGLVNKAKG